MKHFIIHFFCLLIIGTLSAGIYLRSTNYIPPQEYQITVNRDTVIVQCGLRFVGKCQLNKLDSLIINDNQ